MEEISAIYEWLKLQFDNIGAGLITTAAIFIFVLLRNMLWLKLNQLLPLTLKEYELLNGVRSFMPPAEIAYTAEHTIVAGTFTVKNEMCTLYLKAIRRLFRKGAITKTSNGNNAFVYESYAMSAYGHNRMERYEKFRKIREVFKLSNLKRTLNEVRSESDRK
ncbi:hypothetical protein [Vibrio metoecus]|uniref:hypothetical protein n=1 Tax=Vibrio metoecus TaxID=1481663 RepID=UPI000BA98353|nr:hypothetical protein [Vibrio metoecus]PAR26444.1 hypothetical protein CGU00_18650 [Vibrio metoecus]PAR59891.1 hypothetical protein CGT90_18285 [Vibrio metoecus]